jgi:hypothetical protein
VAKKKNIDVHNTVLISLFLCDGPTNVATNVRQIPGQTEIGHANCIVPQPRPQDRTPPIARRIGKCGRLVRQIDEEIRLCSSGGISDAAGRKSPGPDDRFGHSEAAG